MSEQKEFFQYMHGEAVDGGDAYLRSCAQLLARAMNHPAHYQASELTDAEVDLFRARLRAARASSKIDSGRVAMKGRSSQWLLPIAASVILTVGAVSIGWEYVANNVEQTQVAMRSLDSVSMRVVDDPKAVVKAIQAHLSEFEIDSTISEQQGVWHIEAFVPASQEAQVNRMLTPYQMEVGKNGHFAYGLKQR